MKKRINVMCLTVILAAIVAALGAISVGAFGNNPSVNGQGFLTGSEGGLRTFSFSAVTKNDGTVTGQANLHNRDEGNIYKVQINCLQIVGNRASVSGVIKSSTVPGITGQNAVFVVIDNGEGSGSAPDQISRLLITDEEVNCRTDIGFRLFDIEGGNIQVKP